MSKTIVVVGFGPGISTAVAEKFGAEGLRRGACGAERERLAAGVEALIAKGVACAAAFPADAATRLDSLCHRQARADFGA